MNRTNVVCLLLAVAGLSFGIGQTTQDSASAGVQQARVQRVKDKEANRRLHLLFLELGLVVDYQHDARDRLDTLSKQIRAVCDNVHEVAGPDPTNQRPCP